MPTYEYECQLCNLRFEEFQSIAAEPLKECPGCKGAVKRVFSSGAGFIFKGSGFYATDYRSKEYIKRKEEESGSRPDKKEEAKKEKEKSKAD